MNEKKIKQGRHLSFKSNFLYERPIIQFDTEGKTPDSQKNANRSAFKLRYHAW
jgi:hypothetical protein